MEPHKLEKLAAITNEVEEMHPLLGLLFPKLPRISHADYTHGQGEMGADFVLSREDDTFSEAEYIGVIAKIGKIAQDYTDIERQIKECELPRTVFGGKKKIYLTEVWVIVTGSITKNAQEKIEKEYNTRKIKFLSGGRLAELIEKHIPNYWSAVPLHVGEYLTQIWNRNDQLDKRLSLLQVKDKSLYIEQDVYPVVEHEYRKKSRPANSVAVFDMVEQNRAILVEGAMGSGKSKLLRTIVNHYSKAEIYARLKLLPISLTYKEFSDKYEGNIGKVLDATFDEQTRAELPEGNEFLLLIDGADEKDLPLRELLAALTTHLASAAASSDIRIVITTRYLGRFEKNDNILKAANRFELRNLSLTRLIEFIRAICNQFNESSRLLEDIKKSSLFKELPRSPIAAILLARLMNENTEELPSNMTELYSKYTELLLGRWDMDKGLQSQREYEALDKVLTQMAEFIIENQLTAISLQDARQIADKYLAPRHLEVNSQELFDKMLKRCEIVGVDTGKNLIYFKHRTFAEFFYARGMMKSHPMVDSRVFQIYWMNTFFFYVGLQKDCPELLEAILSVEPESETQRWMKIVNMPMYFLAGYASPFDIVEKGVTRMILDAANLYHDVVSRKTESFLSNFSRMQLLCMLQGLVRKSYSYQFFKPALESAALEIADMSIDRTVAAAALFFLSVTNIDLDGEKKNSFDFLLKKYLDDLPLDIQLAVKHEEPKGKDRSDLLKKLDKRFSRAMEVGVDAKKVEFYKAGKAARDKKLDEMYDKPIKLIKIT